MSYSDFINQLKPIHSEEQADWEEAKRTLLNARQVVWSAGSGLLSIVSVLSDRQHATYVELFIDCAGMLFLQPVLLLHLENLLCVEQVFAQYQIPIDAFYAKRVAGKSGSWEFVHSTDSLFMKAVCQMKRELQPKLWAADIPDFCRHEGQAFGVASWYHPQWSSNPQQVQWKHIP